MLKGNFKEDNIMRRESLNSGVSLTYEYEFLDLIKRREISGVKLFIEKNAEIINYRYDIELKEVAER